MILTARVFQPLDGVGQDFDTAKETGSLLLVYLLVVPHTDGDGVLVANITESIGKGVNNVRGWIKLTTVKNSIMGNMNRLPTTTLYSSSSGSNTSSSSILSCLLLIYNLERAD